MAKKSNQEPWLNRANLTKKRLREVAKKRPLDNYEDILGGSSEKPQSPESEVGSQVNEANLTPERLREVARKRKLHYRNPRDEGKGDRSK